MSEPIISVKNINKNYNSQPAIRNLSFDIMPGEIVGVLGANGAGKTTLLKALTGLISYDGQITMCGYCPTKQRTKLLEKLCFISDVNTLPHWIKVNQCIEYIKGVHPRFDSSKAIKLLKKTNIKANQKVSELSKGMVTQLHLALIMAIDAQILILDEPTIGLDIIHRKQFYTTLLEDYFDEQKTILISSHQIEEIQHILTELVILHQGKLISQLPISQYEEQFTELKCTSAHIEQARKLNPIYEQKDLSGYRFIYEKANHKELINLGEISSPDISDVFIAKTAQETIT